MEKLQAAIQRARQRRESGEPKVVRSRGPVAATDPGLWDLVPLIEIEERRLQRSRIYGGQRSREATYFDKLRTKIMQLCRDNGWKRIIITSATPGCGKTTTALNLAASFGRQRDRRLLVLELDMRRPAMAKMLGHKSTVGVANMLEGEATFEDVAVRMSENVILAMCPGPANNPAQIILRDTTPAMLDGIEARYKPDITIIDSPPLMATDDTMALLKYVDCALIIAAAEQTTTSEVDNCEKEIAEQTNVLGVVLNRCQYMEQDYGYLY